jgi:hypothetical protein
MGQAPLGQWRGAWTLGHEQADNYSATGRCGSCRPAASSRRAECGGVADAEATLAEVTGMREEHRLSAANAVQAHNEAISHDGSDDQLLELLHKVEEAKALFEAHQKRAEAATEAVEVARRKLAACEHTLRRAEGAPLAASAPKKIAAFLTRSRQCRSIVRAPRTAAPFQCGPATGVSGAGY